MWPKMERCNARSMEIYRRLGVAENIRAAGMPAHIPMDVFIVTSLIEPPLLHLPYPSVAEARKQIAARNDGTLPLEPYQLISQYTLEPLLKSVAETLPSVTVRYGCEFLSFKQDAHSVTAEVSEGGKDSTITARYLVGCDGGTSTRAQAARLQARRARATSCSSARRSTAATTCSSASRSARAATITSPTRNRRSSSCRTRPGISRCTRWWRRTTTWRPCSSGPSPCRCEYEMLYVGEWRQNLLVADRYMDGRVILAGDAVHLMIPTGGLGMNTGVGDAIDLGWKLAATLQGWGGPALLASYEAERRPIGLRNVAASRYASLGRRKWRAQHKPEMFDNTPEGAEARANLVAVADVEQRKTNEMIGAELGYRYDDSPLIAHQNVEQPGEEPPDDFIDYVPTARPGARLPHVWLRDGTAMQDRIGDGYTLLRLGETAADTRALARAFGALGAPYAEFAAPGEAARDVYGADLVLVRPDLHVVWRGNRPPDDPGKLAAVATGHRC